MSIAAGRLRERIDIQNPPASDDGAGGQAGDWTTVARISAEVVALRGEQAVLAGIQDGVTSFTVTVRNRSIDDGQRLAWRGWHLDVRAVLPGVDRSTLQLLCEGRRA